MVVLSASGTGRIVVLPDPYSMIASKIRIKESHTGFVFKIHIPDSLSRFRYRIRIQDSHSRFVFKLMPASMNECMPGGTMQGFFSVADEGCPFDALCRVSFRGNMLRSYQGPMRGVLPGDDVGCPSGTYAECPFGSLSRVSVRGRCHRSS